MTQNKSSAVMQQRSEPHDSLDYFPTPSWAARALCEALEKLGYDARGKTCWEPACGGGHMVRGLWSYFGAVKSTDVHDYGFGDLHDFLLMGEPICRPHWIITNPPFRLGLQFIKRALEIDPITGVAMLVRSAFLESRERFDGLFSSHPPTDVFQFVERVPMVKGRVSKEATTATSYCWLTWIKGRRDGTSLHWIGPCRKRLEREGDYV